MMIDPIGAEQQRQVISEVQRYVVLAGQHYGQSFPRIAVTFDLRGRAAGMYRVTRPSMHRKISRTIRFNPWLFAKYSDDSWQNTIPHEVAHYITDCLYGLGTIKPHGFEWREVMSVLGAEPTVTANYSLEGIPTRQVKRYAYRCACREVQLTAYRHRRIMQGQQQYRCKDCGHMLVPCS